MRQELHITNLFIIFYIEHTHTYRLIETIYRYKKELNPCNTKTKVVSKSAPVAQKKTKKIYHAIHK
jgi:hypothetical protein